MRVFNNEDIIYIKGYYYTIIEDNLEEVPINSYLKQAIELVKYI